MSTRARLAAVTAAGRCLAALALFAFGCVDRGEVLRPFTPAEEDHVLWGTLMLVLAVYGPGKLSVDRLLAR